MVILIQQKKDPDDRITYGGPMGRVGIWRYLKERFPGSERIFVVQGIQTRRPIMGRYHAAFNNLIRIVVELIKSKNKIVLLFYPNFPYQPLLNFTTFSKALIFMTLVKVIFFIKKGEIITYFHDLPRLGEGSAFFSTHELSNNTMKLFEFLIAHMSTVIWTSSRPIKKFLISDLHLKPDHVQTVIFGNVRTRELFQEEKKDDKVRFLYCGLLDKVKGIDEMIEAFLKANIKNAELCLCGPTQNWTLSPNYKKHGVKYIGLPNSEEEAISIARSCDVGIIPHPRHRYNDMIFPSKLSFYITCELPVLTIDTIETSRIVLENKIGISCSIEEMTENMRLLAKNKVLRQIYQENCRKIKEDYFWDNLLDRAFERILSA